MEKKGINLSYSAVDSYLTCSEKFRLERIEKVLPRMISPPLFFGKAFDQATEVIFKDKMTGEKRVEFSRDTMIKVFTDSLTNIDYQGDTVNAREAKIIKYAKADVDFNLLEKQDIQEINQFVDSKGLELDSIKEYIEYYKDNKKPTEEEKEIYDYIAWLCIYRTGIHMLDALKKWSDENVKEVISIQRFFEIKNEDGDIFRGLIDLEAILYSNPDEVVTIDIKTSRNAKKDYHKDKIKNDAMQLYIYSEVSNPKVGYVAVDKSVKKKEPRVSIVEIYDTITDEQKDKVFSKIDEALQGIKAGVFEKNTDACFKFSKCSFYELCHNGSRQGLVNREEWEKNIKEKKEKKLTEQSNNSNLENKGE